MSQTEGKELPTIGVDELTGDVAQYADFFKATEQASFERRDGYFRFLFDGLPVLVGHGLLGLGVP